MLLAANGHFYIIGSGSGSGSGSGRGSGSGDDYSSGLEKSLEYKYLFLRAAVKDDLRL